jgi:putative ABC transport system permease protein
MLENIRLSLKGILSHKLRSFLTMLGIIIGIASIIAIVSTIQGTNEQIKNNLVGSGTNTVEVTLNQDGYSYDFTWNSVPDGVPVLEESVKEEILALSQVDAVTFVREREYVNSMYYKNNDMTSCNLLGIDADYLSTAGYQVIRGRGLTENDFNENAKVCLIDKTAESSNFQGEEALGATIDIMGEPFTVVGVVDKKSQFEPVINSIDDWWTYSDTSSGTVLVPTQIWPVIYRYDEPQSVMVHAVNTDAMTEAGSKTAEILNSYLSVSDDSTLAYKSQDLLAQAQQLQELSSSTNAMLIAIASISLLVGGIGVMNIMLVSVTERTREIGLKKALGARKRQILGQFLTEAVVLSAIGGLIGVVAGVVLAQVIAQVAQVPVAISTPAILVAVAFSMLVGVIFGFIPSVKASNLNPIDALRYE